MRNSCVSRPANRALTIIRSEDLEFTGNDHCAAALISYFEHWHNIRIAQSRKAKEENDVRELHGDSRNQNESLVQFHSLEQLSEGLCGIYKRDAIRAALQKLVDLKLIDVFRNPNPRYSFDRTSHFLFHPEVLNDWFNTPRDDKSTVDSRKTDDGESENQRPSSENRSPSSENRTAIQELTKEITNEKKNSLSAAQSANSGAIAKAAAGSKSPIHRIDKVKPEQQAIWFEQFWDQIPTSQGPMPFWRKDAKTDAKKAFAKLITTSDRFEQLMQITSQKWEVMILREERHRPYPATWLRSEPWNDLGEASPPQQAIALAAANGTTGARLSRKEQASIEFDERMMRELGLK